MKSYYQYNRATGQFNDLSGINHALARRMGLKQAEYSATVAPVAVKLKAKRRRNKK